MPRWAPAKPEAKPEAAAAAAAIHRLGQWAADSVVRARHMMS